MGALSVVGRLNVVDKRLEQLGLWSKLGIMSAFKEPEILDDLVDHWGAGAHAQVCCDHALPCISHVPESPWVRSQGMAC